MAINPDNVSTIRVGQLPPEIWNLTDNLPHEVSNLLKKGTVQGLADLISDYIGTVSSLALNTTVVNDGETLPETSSNEFLFVGSGTFQNVGGGDPITTTEPLNVLTSNGSFWSLAVAIPVNVELAGIVQTIRSGFTTTTPSENAVFNALSLKLNSGGYPGTGQDLADLISNIEEETDLKWGYVTPEEYGAIGDGVVDDKVAIQNAVNSGKPVKLGFKSYYISGTIDMPTKSSISGYGEASLILTASNYSAFNVVGADVSIYNIGMLGAGKDSGLTNNNGIILTGTYPATSNSSLTLNDLYIVGFSNAGIKQVGATSGAYRPSIVANNINAGGNNLGIDIGVRGEYSSFSNCIISGNNTGVRMSGGNNNFVGGQIVSNVDGVVLVGGENDGHSVMTGVAINHNTGNTIRADGLTYGYLFDSCMMYGGVDIYISSSSRIKISNCDIGVTGVKTSGSTIEFINNKWVTTPVFTDSYAGGGVSTIRYMNNYFVSGGQPSSIQSTFLEPVNVSKKLVVNTGTSGANLDIPNQSFGTVDFSNSSGANTVPTITGKSNDRTGLTFIAATNDVNSSPDFSLNVRENDNSDFTTLTSIAFRFSRFGTTLLDIFRNGVVQIPNLGGSGDSEIIVDTNGNLKRGAGAYFTKAGNDVTLNYPNASLGRLIGLGGIEAIGYLRAPIIELPNLGKIIGDGSGTDYLQVTRTNKWSTDLKFQAINFIGTSIPSYANDAAADADSALVSGSFYKITGNRTLFQKP